MLASATPAAGIPDDFEAIYKITASGNTIARTVWQINSESGGRRVFKTKTESVGLFKLIKGETVTELSRWEARNGKVHPLHYEHERQGGKRDRSISADFDYDRLVVKHRYGGDRWETPIQGHTVDSLSYLVELAGGLAAGKRRFTFDVVEAQKRKVYHLVAAGEEAVQTPVATYQTVIVKREAMRDNRGMTLWCAVALGYLPVKIVHKESEGYELNFLLESLSVR